MFFSFDCLDLMDYCFSSICPNDLINNVDEAACLPKYQDSSLKLYENNVFSINSNNFFTDDAYVTGSSSCSPSSVSLSSSSSSSAPSPLFDQLKPQVLSTNNINSCVLGKATSFNKIDEISSFQQITTPTPVTTITQPSYFTIDSTQTPTTSIDYILNSYQMPKLNESLTKLSPGVFQIQKNPNVSKVGQILVTNGASSNVTVSPQTSNVSLNSQPVLIVDSTSNSNATKSSGKHSLSSPTNSNVKVKKANILPPSPPSSFVSDSESNHSSSSSGSSTNGASNSNAEPSSTKTVKAALKLNHKQTSNSIKSSSSMIKQLRHQPYSSSSKSSSVSSKSSSKNAKISNCNSDDDCWPFLCSLSVS